MTPEELYELARQCARLERAALALTLTNNPAPELAARLDEQIAAMQALIPVPAEPAP